MIGRAAIVMAPVVLLRTIATTAPTVAASPSTVATLTASLPLAVLLALHATVLKPS